MDIYGKDVMVNVIGQKAYNMRLNFKDGTVMSPSEVFEVVKELTKKHSKVMHDTVGRVGHLLVGTPDNSFVDFTFSMGWYFRKAVEKYEKTHGECTIEYETENVEKQELIQYLGTSAKRYAEKIGELGDEILRSGLPEDFFDSEENQ